MTDWPNEYQENSLYFRHWSQDQQYSQWPWEQLDIGNLLKTDGIPVRTSCAVQREQLITFLKPIFHEIAGETDLLNATQLEKLLGTIGNSVTGPELEDIMQTYDADSSGELDFDEIVSMLCATMNKYCCCFSVSRVDEIPTVITFHVGLSVRNILPNDLLIEMKRNGEESTTTRQFRVLPGQKIDIPNWDTDICARLRVFDYEGLESESVIVYNDQTSFTDGGKKMLASCVCLVGGGGLQIDESESQKRLRNSEFSNCVTPGMEASISYPSSGDESAFQVVIGSTHWVVNHTTSHLKILSTTESNKKHKALLKKRTSEVQHDILPGSEDSKPVPFNCVSGQMLLRLADDPDGETWSSAIDVSAPGVAECIVGIEKAAGCRKFVIEVEAGAEPYTNVTIVRIMPELLLSNNTDYSVYVRDEAILGGNPVDIVEPGSTTPICQRFRPESSPYELILGISDVDKPRDLISQTPKFNALQKDKPFWVKLESAEHGDNKHAKHGAKAEVALHLRKIVNGKRATIVVRSTHQVSPPYRLVNRSSWPAKYRLMYGKTDQRQPWLPMDGEIEIRDAAFCALEDHDVEIMIENRGVFHMTEFS
eukprot:SAG31_NODE_5835_length_2303_cov_1.621597_1_plen_593_part_10